MVAAAANAHSKLVGDHSLTIGSTDYNLSVKEKHDSTNNGLRPLDFEFSSSKVENRSTKIPSAIVFGPYNLSAEARNPTCTKKTAK